MSDRLGRLSGTKEAPELRERVRSLRRENRELKQRINQQQQRIKRLREEGEDPAGVPPENLVRIFGSGRTGSSWLSRMMASPSEHSRWNEPRVGALFGDVYEQSAHLGERDNYILADRHRGVWLRALRSFVLGSAGARYPERVEGGYLITKEPHGSRGAPLLMEALPESRMVFLVRDPRDTVASALDAHRAGSWAAKRITSDDPDLFVTERAERYLQDIFTTRRAYEAHEGRKAFVKYEELMADTVGTMKRIYKALEMPIPEGKIVLAVEKHSWENIPEEKKGEGKIFRKASPGGWREDLTPEQIATVERITAPILEEFYP
jgi:Sulfotransferase family